MKKNWLHISVFATFTAISYAQNKITFVVIKVK